MVLIFIFPGVEHGKKTYPKDVETFLLEMSDGTMVKVYQDENGIVQVCYDYIHQVVNYMKQQDPSMDVKWTQSLIINTFDTVKCVHKYDYLTVVLKQDGEVSVVCSDVKIRDSVSVDISNGQPSLWFDSYSSETHTMDETGKFKIPEIPRKRTVAKKLITKKKSTYKEAKKKSQLKQRLRKFEFRMTGPRKLLIPYDSGLDTDTNLKCSVGEQRKVDG